MTSTVVVIVTSPVSRHCVVVVIVTSPVRRHCVRHDNVSHVTVDLDADGGPPVPGRRRRSSP